jgi:hypothetical protein
MAGILMIGAVAYPLLPVAPLPQVDDAEEMALELRATGAG